MRRAPWIALPVALLVTSHYAPGMTQSALRVAISPDIPPYVMDGATTGLELEIVSSALAGHGLRFLQIPYEELQSAIGDGRADVSVGVQEAAGDGVHYSGNFITFANYAISKRADGLTIDRIEDLAGHRVLTWQNADLELGEAFRRLFAPDAPERRNYIEVADQEEQVRRFWEDRGDVVVIDRSIFRHFSEAMGHSMVEASLHALFPPVTHFRVGFADAALRDAFDRGIAELCSSGRYASLLQRYGVHLESTICDGLGE